MNKTIKNTAIAIVLIIAILAISVFAIRSFTSTVDINTTDVTEIEDFETVETIPLTSNPENPGQYVAFVTEEDDETSKISMFTVWPSGSNGIPESYTLEDITHDGGYATVMTAQSETNKPYLDIAWGKTEAGTLVPNAIRYIVYVPVITSDETDGTPPEEIELEDWQIAAREKYNELSPEDQAQADIYGWNVDEDGNVSVNWPEDES